MFRVDILSHDELTNLVIFAANPKRDERGRRSTRSALGERMRPALVHRHNSYRQVKLVGMVPPTSENRQKKIGRYAIYLYRVTQLERLGCLISSTKLRLSTQLERAYTFEPFYYYRCDLLVRLFHWGVVISLSKRLSHRAT